MKILNEEEAKIYIKGPGHMIKMAAMPIYGKILKKFFSTESMDRFQETWHIA